MDLRVFKYTAQIEHILENIERGRHWQHGGCPPPPHYLCAGFSRCSVGWGSGSRVRIAHEVGNTSRFCWSFFCGLGRQIVPPTTIPATPPPPPPQTLTHPLCVWMKERAAMNGKAVRAHPTQPNKPSFFWNCVQFAHSMHWHTDSNTPLRRCSSFLAVKEDDWWPPKVSMFSHQNNESLT